MPTSLEVVLELRSGQDASTLQHCKMIECQVKKSVVNCELPATHCPRRLSLCRRSLFEYPEAVYPSGHSAISYGTSGDAAEGCRAGIAVAGRKCINAALFSTYQQRQSSVLNIARTSPNSFMHRLEGTSCTKSSCLYSLKQCIITH